MSQRKATTTERLIATRISPILHRRVVTAAAREGISVADYLRRLILRDQAAVSAKP